MENSGVWGNLITQGCKDLKYGFNSRKPNIRAVA